VCPSPDLVWHSVERADYGRVNFVKKSVSLLLSLCIGLFLADGLISFVDDTIIISSGVHALDVVRGLVFLPAIAMSLVV